MKNKFTEVSEKIADLLQQLHNVPREERYPILHDLSELTRPQNENDCFIITAGLMAYINHLTVPTPVNQGSVTFTAGATSADSKLLMVDIYNPMLKYAFANLTRTTANAVIGGIIAIQYNAENRPTAHDASVIASTFALGAAA